MLLLLLLLEFFLLPVQGLNLFPHCMLEVTTTVIGVCEILVRKIVLFQEAARMRLGFSQIIMFYFKFLDRGLRLLDSWHS